MPLASYLPAALAGLRPHLERRCLVRTTLVVHVLTAGLGLLFGYLALAAPKGARLHRKSGLLFTGAMLTMSLAGMTISVVKDVAPAVNVPAGVLTAYLVLTGLVTIRPVTWWSRRLDIAAMLVALTVGVTSLVFGFEALAAPDGTRNGMPAFPFLMFGVVGSLAGVSDLRMLRAGRPQGASRLARHLWRMCFGLFIAALSFFIGQADRFPEALRIPALLGIFPLATLGAMVYWLWRVRIRRTFASPRLLAVGDSATQY